MTRIRFRSRGPEQARSLTVKAQGAGLGFTLDEPSQGGLSVVLHSGATAWCSRFGGTVKRDEPGRFLATKAPAASDGCR